jgi:LCP family protein required for cell wall assembly
VSAYLTGARPPVRPVRAVDTTRDDADVTDSGTDEERADQTADENSATNDHYGDPAGDRPPRRWLRWAAAGTSVLVLTAAGGGWAIYQKLDGNIRTDVGTAKELRRYAAERPDPRPGGRTQNILLLGSDNRDGGNSAYGHEGGQRSDTAILLHIAADHRSATGVSLPRDLMVDLPACTRPDGSRTEPQFAQFNSAFQLGGAACTIRTVEKMTGMRVDHHLVVDFTGFKSLVDTVGGVEVCLPAAVRDRDAKLDLPAGRQNLGGEDALGYVRARHGIGNGSDTQRIGRQQQFLGSLVKKVRGNGVLLNPTKLYPVLEAATSALTADQGLDSLSELYELVRGVRDITEDHVRFLTVPRQSYAGDKNRDELLQPDAGRLFAQLRDDRPVQVDSGSSQARQATSDPSASADAPSRNQARGHGVGSSTGKNPEQQTPKHSDQPEKPSPVYRGTTAAHDICTADNAEIGAN